MLNCNIKKCNVATGLSWRFKYPLIIQSSLAPHTLRQDILVLVMFFLFSDWSSNSLICTLCRFLRILPSPVSALRVTSVLCHRYESFALSRPSFFCYIFSPFFLPRVAFRRSGVFVFLFPLSLWGQGLTDDCSVVDIYAKCYAKLRWSSFLIFLFIALILQFSWNNFVTRKALVQFLIQDAISSWLQHIKQNKCTISDTYRPDCAAFIQNNTLLLRREEAPWLAEVTGSADTVTFYSCGSLAE